MNRIALPGRTTRQVLVCFALLLAFAVVANAQTFVPPNTTTVLWAGSQDVTTFGFTGFTAPSSGTILSGTAISAITGKPVRHMWYGDPINGLCRIDPEVDAVIPPAAGLGGHNVNVLTCLASIQKTGLNPGMITFDATTNNIYSEDTGRTNAGILRAHYIPSGDNGQGSIDLVRVDSLVGTQNTRNAFGGCPQLKDPKTGSPVPTVPDAVALGPDGNLYAGSIRDGAILRIISPATFNTSTDCVNPGDSGQNPNAKLQLPLASADERFGAGHTFGLGWVGHTLFGADNIAPWIKENADQCLTPINGNTACANPLWGGAPLPLEILAAQAGAPQAGLVSDAIYPTYGGNVIYVASFPNVTRITNIASATNMTVNLNYGGTFSFVTGLIADPADLNNATVYVGADPTKGGINGSGQIWQVTAVAQNIPPVAPGITSAVAGPSTGQATVTWAPVLNGAPITTYVVQTLLAPALPGGTPTPSAIPNVTVAAPTTTTVISGLTAGTSYVFEVQACNAFGCSPFSPASAVVTAFAVTAPPAPTSVVGTPLGDGSSAVLAWTQPGTGNSPITSSTIVTTAPLGGAAVPNTVVAGAATGGTVKGLTCGTATGYIFQAFATNAVGSSALSAASPAVIIPCVANADVSVTMSAPATINAGSVLTYSITVSNGGPATATAVALTDALPAPFFSATTSQGFCAGSVGVTTFTCNLGNMAPGTSATISLSVALTAAQTSPVNNTATVSATSPDANLANNTASASTLISTGVTNATTDLQVVGSSNNGNPVHGTPVTFTWQIKNNQGTVTAPAAVFTNTNSTSPLLTVNSVSSSQGTCSLTGNTVTCNLGDIAGGGQAIVTVSATPAVAAPANSYSSTGKVTFTGTDTNPANNSFTVFIGAQ